MLFRSAVVVSLVLTACGSPKGPDAVTAVAPAVSDAPASTAAPVVSAALAGPVASAAPSAPPKPWSYDGDTGPSHWGAIDPSFVACGNGTSQSPVNLVGASMKVSGKAPAPPSWSPVPVKVTNTGHTIQVDDAAPSSFAVDGATYALKNFHFHSPSEHTIDGRTFDVEMHFVHKTSEGKIAVVALFFNHGRANDLLAPVWAVMPANAGGAPATSAATIDVQTLLPKAAKYFRYDGSLTAPPCSEGVKWLVAVPDPAAPLEMSDAQIAQLRTALGGASNRPVQPLGVRTVFEVAP